MDGVLERCIAIVAEAKSIPTAGIGPTTTFEQLGADSLDKINISFSIEEAFGIEIPDNALGSIKTIGDMVAGVEKLQAQQVAGGEGQRVS